MSESNQGFGPRLQFFSMAAVFTAVLTLFGVPQAEPDAAQPNKAINQDAKKATSEIPMPEGLVSLPQGIWEDPYAQLQTAKTLLKSQSTSIDKSQLTKILHERLLPKPVEETSTPSNQTFSHPRLLIIFTLVPGATSDSETRLRVRHSFEIAVSSRGFRPVLADRISFLQFPTVKTHFSNSVAAEENADIPVKLYQKTIEDQANGIASTEMILNLWVNQDLLGEYPWSCINSIAQTFDASSLHPMTQLAVLGPTSSDIFKRMRPDSKDNTHFFIDQVKDRPLKSLEKWHREIKWISSYCTVPISRLWSSKFSPANQTGNSIAIDFQSSILDDASTILVLGDELRARLGSSSLLKRQILLFVEQDREFGRTLSELLQEELDNAFEFVIIPYLRGISSSPKSSKNSTVAEGDQVSDYFERTLERETEPWLHTDAKTYKPAAIGIFGGSREDKRELLREIRVRFPQSLCFTNDFDASFADQKFLHLTKNLTIVSHQDTKPLASPMRTKERFGISFRDEYQAAQFHGVTALLNQVFPVRDEGAALATSGRTGEPCIFEIGGSTALKIPLDANINEPFTPVLLSLLGVAIICLCFLFPLIDIDWWKKKLKLAEASKDSASFESPFLTIFSSWYRNLIIGGPAFFIPVFVFAICLSPLSKREADGNRLLTLLSGVNVVPSILCLSIVIPFLFRRAVKSEIFRDTRREDKVNEVMSNLRDCRNSLMEGPHLPITTVSSRNTEFGYGRRAWRVAAAATIALIGVLTWYWTDDAWLVQTGTLGAVSYSILVKPTSRLAIGFALGIALCIGIIRLYTRDYPLVPARDEWIRAVGSSVFVVAYWWLLVGLLKLIIYLRNLQRILREASSLVWWARDTRKVVDPFQAAKFDNLIQLAGDTSAIVLRDLGILLLIGLVVCLARMPVFDSWGLSSATWLTIIVPMALPFFIAVATRRRAWQFRDNLLQYLSRAPRQKLLAPEDNKEQEAALQARATSIRTFDKGAFSPLDRDPLVSSGLALLIALFSGPNSELLKKFILTFVA